MVAGCGSTCIKYIFFTFNFLIFLCGGALVGVSLWARFDNNFQSVINTALKNNVQLPAQVENLYIALYVIIAIGGVLLLCGFLGCCGACCESTPLLGLFFTIILVIFLAEIAGSIYVFVQKDALKADLGNWYKRAFVDNYGKTGYDDITKFLDSTQADFDCCGANGCADYLTPPTSCKCSALSTTRGCVDVAYDALKSHLPTVAGVAAAFLLIELLAMIFSCILCCAARQYY